MSNTQVDHRTICINCMSDTQNIGVATCPQCNKPDDCKNSESALKERTLLNNNRYFVGKCLGAGGFGITYLGLDLRLNMPVAIKEFFPKDLVKRQSDQITVTPKTSKEAGHYKHGLSKFLEEAQTIAQVIHPSIVTILFDFEENGTAYFVMRYIPGKTLEEIMGERQGKITENEILSIIIPLLDGLQELHKKNILHRDIKPANIFISNNGTPVLLDFGSAREAIHDESQGLSIFLTHGYAPLEQYPASENQAKNFTKQGPWTDIYACAATIYSCLRGQMKNGKLMAPPQAIGRMQGKTLPHIQDAANCKVSSCLNEAVMRGLEIHAKNRPQSIEEFRGIFGTTSPPPPRNCNLELVVLAGEYEGEKLPLATKAIIIGRNPKKSALIFSSEIISSTHCQIHSVNGIAYVKDLKSTNGTWINDTKRLPPLETVKLYIGDTISLAGSVVFQVVEGVVSKNNNPPEDIGPKEPTGKNVDEKSIGGTNLFKTRSFFDIANLKDLYFSHHGRINRQPYIAGAFLIGLISLICELMILFFFGYEISGLIALVTLYPSLMLYIKRAHDIGKSGHFCWLLLIPIVNLLPIIQLLFFKGTEGSNRFGDDPLC